MPCRDTFCKNIITAGYIATFLFLFARILYIILKSEKPAEEDEPAEDLTEESESIREDCEQEGSVL